MMWRTIPGQAVALHCWNDEFVVYNGQSGDTHLLDAIAGRILMQLQQAPADAFSLSESFAALPFVAAPTGPDQTLMARMENMLAELAALALIERC